MFKSCQASSRLTLSSVLRSLYSEPVKSVWPRPSRFFTPTIRRCSEHEPSSHRHSITSFSSLNVAPTLASAISVHGAAQDRPDKAKVRKFSSEPWTSSVSSRRKPSMRNPDRSTPQHSALRIRAVETKSSAKKEHWQEQKEALKAKFPDGWKPRKRLSPDALDGIRHLHEKDPDKFTTSVLAEQFQVSPEAIRRILKSKWRPSEEESAERRKRWEKRNETIWNHMAEIGLRPERKVFSPQSDTEALILDPHHIGHE